MGHLVRISQPSFGYKQILLRACPLSGSQHRLGAVVGLQGQDHVLLQGHGMIRGKEGRDHRRFMDIEPDAVADRAFRTFPPGLESPMFGRGPDGAHVCGGHARLDLGDGFVSQAARFLVQFFLLLRGATAGKSP